ncbi:hypothetical protein BSPA14S_PA0059, partial (plasmid) [Borreliella spielmanii A14S]
MLNSFFNFLVPHSKGDTICICYITHISGQKHFT